MDFKGKTVVITGGSRGIGKACCEVFAKSGANVVFTYLSSTSNANKLKKQLGAKSMALKADIRDYEQCRGVLDKALKKFKRVDILINNAGIIKDKALVMMAIDEWKEVIDTNLGGTFNMSRAFITTFLKQKSGCIINMSSISGIVGMAKQTNYSASKAGIIGFSKALAKEVTPYNVRVNVVCPGFIGTDMVNGLHDFIKDKILMSIPSKRFGKVEEVAELVLYLASEKAAYITGEVIKIDGGLAI
jgi:3-oxoacyl-[acyl-carrier protein] reductase